MSYKRRCYFIFLTLATIVHIKSYAAQPDFDSIDLLPQKKIINGKESYYFELSNVMRYLEKIEPYAATYPPIFKDAEERKFIEAKLLHLLKVLKILDTPKIKDPDFLTMYGWALAMGHNLDLPNSDREAISVFERSLAIDPDRMESNYYYGVFLSGTLLCDKAIPYLKKAISKGAKSAKYPLALVYIQNPNTIEKGKQILREYIKDFPKDKRAVVILQAVEQGGVFKQLDSH